MMRSSPGVRRVAAILDFIAEHPGQSFTLTDLVRALKLSRATCHALLTSLTEVGYLYRSNDKTYVLGPRLAAIGRVATRHGSPLQIAQPEMRRLADRYDIVCAAYFLEQDDVVVRERAASLSHVGWSMPIGTRLKLRPPFGSIFFAWHPDGEAEAWLDRSQPPPTREHRDQMMAGMAFLRRRRYSVHVRNPNADAASDRPPEQLFAEEPVNFPTSLLGDIVPDRTYQLVSVVAPVFDVGERIAFVLNLTGFGQPPTAGRDVAAIGTRLVAACDRISHFITGRPPPDADDPAGASDGDP